MMPLRELGNFKSQLSRLNNSNRARSQLSAKVSSNMDSSVRKKKTIVSNLLTLEVSPAGIEDNRPAESGPVDHLDLIR